MKFNQSIHRNFKLNGISYSAKALVDFSNDHINSEEEQNRYVGLFLKEWFEDVDHVLVKTSGSTGTPKTIQLKKTHMVASAKATGKYFNLYAGTSALLCLPANFIAGKMMLVRAMVLGWDLHIMPPKAKGVLDENRSYDFTAMVPLQLYHALENLDKVKTIIVGGAVVSPELEAEIQHEKTEIFTTYGMTETCTHVAIKAINGQKASGYYKALPEVFFEQDQRDCLVINAPHVLDGPMITNDVVELKSPNRFIWLGRYDHVINSGGLKLYPEQIEALLAKTLALPFFIASEPDAQLGERLILIVEGTTNDLAETVFSALEKYQKPKKIYAMPKFSYTETGKIKRNVILKQLGIV